MLLPDFKTPLLWLLGLGLVAALATAGIERTRAAGARADAATARKDLSDYKLAVSETTRVLQAANDRKAADNTARQLEAKNAASTREARLRDDASGARSELDRLRSAVRAAAARRDPVPGAAAGADAQPAAAEGELLTQCTEQLVDVAAAADAHASDVQTLTESWPR